MRPHSRRIWLATLVVLSFAALAASASAAEPWPARTVRIIVPFPPGGATDIIARQVAVRLTDALGQQFIVDNRGGANGIIGTDAAAKSKPDGYTLLISAAGPLASGLALFKNIPYDVMRDLEPITPVSNAGIVLVASPAFAPRTLAEVIAAAKAKPQGVRAVLSTIGSIQHLLIELLRLRAGVDLMTVPYKGSGPAVIDLVGGHVDISFQSIPDVIDMIRGGRLKAIAVTGSKRIDTLPDVPTFKELGMPEFVAESWFAMLAPKGTPPEIIEKLSKTLSVVLTLPEVKAQFAKQGMAPVYMTPAEAGRFIGSEVARWAAIVKESGAKGD